MGQSLRVKITRRRSSAESQSVNEVVVDSTESGIELSAKDANPLYIEKTEEEKPASGRSGEISNPAFSAKPENVGGVEIVAAKRFFMAQSADGRTYYYPESGDGGSMWKL